LGSTYLKLGRTVVPPDKLDSRAQLSAMKKGTGVPPETLALGPNCPGGPKFLSWKKKGQFTPDTLAPNMCLEKWTVVPSDKLGSGKCTVVPWKL